MAVKCRSQQQRIGTSTALFKTQRLYGAATAWPGLRHGLPQDASCRKRPPEQRLPGSDAVVARHASAHGMRTHEGEGLGAQSEVYFRGALGVDLVDRGPEATPFADGVDL